MSETNQQTLSSSPVEDLNAMLAETSSDHGLGEIRTKPLGMTHGEFASLEHRENRPPPGGELVPIEEQEFDNDGNVIIPDRQLEICVRVQQQFSRYPESALANRFEKFSPEYNLRQDIRINAMKWLKPGKVPSTKVCIKTKQDEDKQEVLAATGIRLNRTLKKRVLPQQVGQVVLDLAEDREYVKSQNLLTYDENLDAGMLEHTNVLAGAQRVSAPALLEQHRRGRGGNQALLEHDDEENDKAHDTVVKVKNTKRKSTPGSSLVTTADVKIVSKAEIGDSFRVHPSIHRTALSDRSRATVADEDDDDAEEDGTVLTSKKQKLSSNTAAGLMVEELDSDNDNAKEDYSTMTADHESITNTAAIHSFLAVDVPKGQSAEESARIAQTYGRAFYGANVPVMQQGKVQREGVQSVTATEIGDDDEEDMSMGDNNSNSIESLSSSANKVIRKNKQEQQEWSSKAGVYGGAVVSEVDTKDSEEQRLYAEQEAHDTIKSLNIKKNIIRPTAVPCYVCKTKYKLLHHFYDRLCPTCAEFNFKKRFQTANMRIKRVNPETGEPVVIQRVCFVTGARVKIGYEIALKLLRSGAFVIATSRFARDTALRFTQEPDFHEWKHSLHIYACDFRVLSAVEMLIQHIIKYYPRLDMIMNNAAQTIRRPPQFYAHLIDQELAPEEEISEDCRLIIRDFLSEPFRKTAEQVSQQFLKHFGLDTKGHLLLTDESSKISISTDNEINDTTTEDTTTSSTVSVEDAEDNEEVAHVTTTTTTTTNSSKAQCLVPVNEYQSTNALILSTQEDASARLVTMLAMPEAALINPALLTQIALLEEDKVKPEDKFLFPAGALDKDAQQVDLRPRQTWILEAEEVSAVEMAEVQFVNQMAPFMIVTKLKPMMMRSGDAGWVINVSSMEGKFRGFKDITHPHTNMAKAALNMFTHTSAKGFAADKIFMNAVDTGWVTEELPHTLAKLKAQRGFAPPLDEIDGAARCLDPIYTSLLTGVFEFGKFFKDYGESHW